MALKIKMNETNDSENIKSALAEVGFTLRNWNSSEDCDGGHLEHRNGVEFDVEIFDEGCDIYEIDISNIVGVYEGVAWYHPQDGYTCLPYDDADDLALRLKGIAEALAVVANIYKR